MAFGRFESFLTCSGFRSCYFVEAVWLLCAILFNEINFLIGCKKFCYCFRLSVCVLFLVDYFLVLGIYFLFLVSLKDLCTQGLSAEVFIFIARFFARDAGAATPD